MTIKSQVLKYYSDRTEKRVVIFNTLILQIKATLVLCCSSLTILLFSHNFCSLQCGRYI